MGLGPHCAWVEGAVGRRAEACRGLMEISVGYRVVRPYLALIRLEDSFHLDPWWEALESEGIGVHQFG